MNLFFYACILISGGSALIYEVVWAKYLSVLFGNSTYAYTIVLATFMGGLALGSFMLGKLADRTPDKIRLYGLTEIGIAVFCAFTPRLFLLSKHFYLAAARKFAPHSPELTFIMCFIGATIMLIPTIFMGGTLPILSSFMATSSAGRGKTVARLYYVNSLGAVAGTIVAGYWLIYYFGLGYTLLMAALANLVVGCAILLFRAFRGKAKPADWGKKDIKLESISGGRAWPHTRFIAVVTLIAIAMSGFASMLYEIVWVRLLSLVLGSSTYSFSIMLAAFISGITIGSFIVSRYMPDERKAFLTFGLCEACIALFLLISIPFYVKLPYVFADFSKFLSRRPEVFGLYEGAKLFISFLVMLPPTIFLGMTLPLASVIASGKSDRFGGNVGGVFAMNTGGNILGALVTGLALVPMLGLQHTLELGVIINLGLGALILCLDVSLSWKRKLSFSFLCGAALFANMTLVPDWNKAHFTAQPFRRGSRNRDIAPASIVGVSRVLYYKDGLNASVSVVEHRMRRTLYVNGKADASTGGDMFTQTFLAGVPLSMRPATKDVMVIGLGSGVTCGTALRYPIRSLDIVELSPEVAEANVYFARENGNALKDPRVALHIEDARTYLQRIEKKYDLIISEPSNPWMSGVGDLYSVEHFRDCLRSLREDGVMAQWVHAYEMDDETFKIIVKTFTSVFPDVTLWRLRGNDLILMGTRRGLKPDLKASADIMATPAVKKALSKFEVNDLFTLLCLQFASSADIRDSVRGEKLVNSDLYPILEYRAPLALYTGAHVGNYLRHIDERRYPLGKYNLLLRRYAEENSITDDNVRNFYGFLKDDRWRDHAWLYPPVLDKLHAKHPNDKELLLAYLSSEVAPLQDRLTQMEEIILKGNNDFGFLRLYCTLLMDRYFQLRSFLTPEVFLDTVERIKLCAELSKKHTGEFYNLLGKVYLHNRDYVDAMQYYKKAGESLKKVKAGEII